MLFRLFLAFFVIGGASVAALALRTYFAKPSAPVHFDLQDIGIEPSPAIIEFTSPFCFECKVALPILKAAALVHDVPLGVIDAKQRPDLINKYGIRSTPTILVVNAAGVVSNTWQETPSEQDLEKALAEAGISGLIRHSLAPGTA